MLVPEGYYMPWRVSCSMVFRRTTTISAQNVTLLLEGRFPFLLAIYVATPPLLEQSFKLLHRFPNLKSLRVDFMPDEDNPVVPAEGGHSYYSYYLQVQLSCLAGLSATHGLPRLRTLHLGSFHTYIPSQQETDALLSLFCTLTSLSLSVLSLAHRVHLPSEAISFNASLLRILNAANNITSLELASHTYEGPLCTFAFEKLRFPALAALSLSRFVLAGQEDDEPIPANVNEGGQRLTLETFILNHGHTLRRLAMHGCAVALPDGQWSCILRRFRLQLPLLVTFVCPSLEDGTFPYVMFIDNVRRYQVSNLQEEDLEVDVKEMQHLQEVLLIRRNKQPSGSII